MSSPSEGNEEGRDSMILAIRCWMRAAKRKKDENMEARNDEQIPHDIVII